MTAEDRRALGGLTDAVSEMRVDFGGRLAKLETCIIGNGTKGLSQRMTDAEAAMSHHCDGHAGKPDRRNVIATRAMEAGIIGVVISGVTLLGKAMGWW